MSADTDGYDVEVWRTAGGFAAGHPALPGLRGYGKTERRARAELAVARARFFARCVAEGWKVPPPDSGGAEVRR